MCHSPFFRTPDRQNASYVLTLSDFVFNFMVLGWRCDLFDDDDDKNGGFACLNYLGLRKSFSVLNFPFVL